MGHESAVQSCLLCKRCLSIPKRRTHMTTGYMRVANLGRRNKSIRQAICNKKTFALRRKKAYRVGGLWPEAKWGSEGRSEWFLITYARAAVTLPPPRIHLVSHEPKDAAWVRVTHARNARAEKKEDVVRSYASEGEANHKRVVSVKASGA